MKTTTRLLTATSIAAIAISFGGTANAQEAFAPTTTDRLLNADAEPHNWLMHNGNYSNWHYSQLDQINKENVGDLRVAYMMHVGGCTNSPSPDVRCHGGVVPLVDNGIMYVNDNYSRIMAFDVRSGVAATMLWHFDPWDVWDIRPDSRHRNRGVALYGNTIIDGTNDAGVIFAVDKRSGELVWEVGTQETAGQPNTAEMIARQSLPAAEQAYRTAGGRDILVTAIGSSSPGVGWLAAYDANDGELVWRTYTIPQPGEANFGSWPGETWRTGAAMPWGPPPAYDPETNLLHWGAGEPTPAYDPEYRPGDNLYSVSRLATDADTGEIAWYFQHIPNDQYDGDSTAQSILYNLDGRSVVSNWGRMGYYYTLDAATGEFLTAAQTHENINWTAGIDPKTGKPIEYVAGAGVQTYAAQGPRRGRAEEDAPLTCPNYIGGPTGAWQASYDPTRGITYNTRDVGCYYHSLTAHVDEEGVYDPLRREGLGSRTSRVMESLPWALIAMDTASGAVVGTVTRSLGLAPGGFSIGMVGALATGGGLVFTGAEDGFLTAHDSDTLEELWRFSVGTKTLGNFMSFAVDGKQYVAILVGGRGGSVPVLSGGQNLIVFSL